MEPARASIRRTGLVVLVVVVLISLATTAFLFLEMASEIGQLKSARSDNVQWTLSQVEVEFLEFKSALDVAVEADEINPDDIRTEFDIFFSRIATVSSGSAYAGLKQIKPFTDSLTIVRTFLDDALPYMDGNDAELAEVLQDLHEQADALRGHVRVLSSSGLSYFAELSDDQRTEIANTLSRLAGITAALVILLVVVALYSNALDKQNTRRRRDASQTALRMQTVMSTSLDAVIVTDIQGKILEFNKAAEEIFKVSKADVIDADLAEVIIPEHLREAHRAGMQRMRDSGEKRVVGKGRVRLEARRANGEVFPVELAIQSAKQSEDEIFIAFLRDISSTIEAEVALILARDKAQESEKAKADFLAVMSHEIRTPLNGLLGNLTLMRGTRLSQKQKNFCENMDISGRLLMSHVDKVLEITTYEAGKLTFESKPVNLSDLLQDLVDGQGGRAEMANNVLEWGWVGKPLDWVLSDPARLNQILLNLVGNAIKFTQHGRISIECEVVDDSDVVPTVEFRVIDTGVGVPPEDIDRIFEDFVTRDSSYVRLAAGTGLGLGIARRITRALGGKIGVRSTLGEGSTFWVRLPLERTSAAKASPSRKMRKQKSRQLEILVIEDNEINRQVAREMLKQEGHLVVEAEDGRTGIALAAEKKFDLILMDISMPVMDGRHATREIRAGHGASCAVPIVALTANVVPESASQFLQDGMNDVLGKPLMRDELRHLIATISEAAAPVVAQSNGDVAELLDSEQLREAKETIGPDSFAKLLTRFCTEGDEAVALLESLKGEAGELEEIVMRAHKLAGSSAVFGARSFREKLRALEAAARDGDNGEVLSLLGGLRQIWEPTRQALVIGK